MVYSTEHKREILYDGIYEGHKFAILDLGTHPTAYVECKIKDCVSYNDERLDDIQVHGGFTFFDKSRWTTQEIFDEVKSVIDQLIKVEFEQNKRF